MSNTKLSIEDLSHIRWACRRGMLELDLMLAPFFEAVYPSLNDAEKQTFIDLLSCSDQALYQWLMGKEEPDEPDLARITELIRSHFSSGS